MTSDSMQGEIFRRLLYVKLSTHGYAVPAIMDNEDFLVKGEFCFCPSTVFPVSYLRKGEYVKLQVYVLSHKPTGAEIQQLYSVFFLFTVQLLYFTYYDLLVSQG